MRRDVTEEKIQEIIWFVKRNFTRWGMLLTENKEGKLFLDQKLNRWKSGIKRYGNIRDYEQFRDVPKSQEAEAIRLSCETCCFLGKLYFREEPLSEAEEAEVERVLREVIPKGFKTPLA
jgi:hypothetical protein